MRRIPNSTESHSRIMVVTGKKTHEVSSLSTMRRLPELSSVITIFVVLFLWSLHAYLTVRFNSDIIVEAIGVQDLMQDLSWVWSYPGQLHGGVIEYPIMAVGEWIAQGNP